MHTHSTPYDGDGDWWTPPPRPQPRTQVLQLALTARMSTQLAAIANDFELDTDEAAFVLLRDSLWRHYHLMQHF